MYGRISRIEPADEDLSVRDAAGKETSPLVDGATKIAGGELKTGGAVTVRYLDKDSKHIAARTSRSTTGQPPTPSSAPHPRRADTDAADPRPVASTAGSAGSTRGGGGRKVRAPLGGSGRKHDAKDGSAPGPLRHLDAAAGALTTCSTIASPRPDPSGMLRRARDRVARTVRRCGLARRARRRGPGRGPR